MGLSRLIKQMVEIYENQNMAKTEKIKFISIIEEDLAAVTKKLRKKLI